MKPILLLLFVATSIFACKKDNHSNFTDGLFVDNVTLMHNQPTLITDTTWIYDSVLEVNPPRNRHYQWIISPVDSQAIFLGNYQYGDGAVIFNRAGTYQLHAAIYDSVGTLIGHTTTATIQVSNDTFTGPLP